MSQVPDADIEGLDLSSWQRAMNGAEPVLVAFAAVQTVAMAALALSALRERALLAAGPVAGTGTA